MTTFNLNKTITYTIYYDMPQFYTINEAGKSLNVILVKLN